MFFNLFNNTSQGSGDTGDASYTNSPLLGAYRDLTYIECRDIYRYWPLGRRMVSALPNFAMSAQRTFLVKNAPPEVNDRLKEFSIDLQIDNVIKQCVIYSRIYGLASIYVAQDKEYNNAITYENIQKKNFKFNVLDPLSLGGSIQIDNNPLSPTFNEPINITIQNKKIHISRVKIIYNDMPLYYKFNPSSFSFSGPSIYQNMTLLIRTWNRAVIALQRLSSKAAAMIKTTKESGNVTGFNLKAINNNLSLIRAIENDGIASIRSGDSLEFFSLTGVQEVDTILNQLNTALMMALTDTPSGILLDKNLSVGLNDGTEDMKAILMAVDNFRLNVLSPLYNFIDKFLCYKAFSKDFILSIINKYPDMYRDKTINEVLQEWLQNYNFEWGELYPQNENEKVDIASKTLDNLIKIKQLGSETSGVEEALNQLNLFGVDFILKEDVTNENFNYEDTDEFSNTHNEFYNGSDEFYNKES